MKKIHAPVIALALTALVLSVAALTAGGCNSSSSPTNPNGGGNGGGTQVTISSFAFSSLTVARGATVTWKNDDSVTHTATADNTSLFQFDTGSIAPGATSGGITFTQSGTFPYHCTFHTGMHGSITVQ